MDINKLIEEMDGRFRSGNSIEIDRIWLSREKWEEIRKALEDGAEHKDLYTSLFWQGVK